MLDAAIQAVAAAIPADGSVYLPAGVTDFSVLGPNRGRVQAIARLTNHQPGQPELSASIELHDSEGPVARIARLDLARVDAPAVSAPANMTYQLAWTETAPAAPPASVSGL